MSKKIDVLGIRLDDYTAKDAMKAITEFIKEEVVSLVEVVTAESVMRMTQNESGQRETCTGLKDRNSVSSTAVCFRL